MKQKEKGMNKNDIFIWANCIWMVLVYIAAGISIILSEYILAVLLLILGEQAYQSIKLYRIQHDTKQR